MRAFKIYLTGVGCWVEYKEQEDAKHDTCPPVVDSNSCSEDSDPDLEFVQPVPELIAR